jgi:hypothetical protein
MIEHMMMASYNV